jgi:uncharacterized protein YndB with AHSA1/START domain
MIMPTTDAKTNATSHDLVKKQVFVKTTPERAFEVFTTEMSTWWPLATHHISKIDAKNAVIEPFVGGRWFERGVDDSECDWGTVLAWDPPARLVLAWQISADWQHDKALMTEVEVRFTAENGGTRVDLEHRLLRNFGPRAEEMRGIFDSQGGWNGMLAAYLARTASA